MTAKEWLKAYAERNGTIPLGTILEEAAKLIEGIDKAEVKHKEEIAEAQKKAVKKFEEKLLVWVRLASDNFYSQCFEDIQGVSSAVIKEMEDNSKIRNRKQSKWLKLLNDTLRLRCGNCDVIHLIAQYPTGEIKYCPNCGAEMTGIEKNANSSTIPRFVERKVKSIENGIVTYYDE